MDLSFETIDALWRPSYVFRHQHFKSRAQLHTSAISWHDSALNPKNRVDSLPAIGSSHSGSTRWRVDGAATFKTRFYAIPLDLLDAGHLPPLRVDVFVPDQGEYPPALKHTLDANRGVPLTHAPAISALGMSRYICGVLDAYCSRNRSFLDRYRRLPYGSRIIISHVEPTLGNVNVSIEPNYTLEGLTTSIANLHEAWTRDKIPLARRPPNIDLFDLCLVRQLHDSVSLVEVLRCEEKPELQGTVAVFKSGSDGFHHILHELKLMLTIPPHANIIGPPLATVTKKSGFGGKQGVYGFLIPYFPSGSLRDILPARSLAQTLCMSIKVRWCIQVTSALLHLFERARTFYSDLRPDNVLLDSEGQAILCDLEQRGSWHEWCPPEVLYSQYLENMLNNQQGYNTQAWDSLIAAYVRKRPAQTGETSFIHSKNRPWFALSRKSQEKAMVYTLGLFIYCVFEGLSSVQPNLAYRFAIEPSIGFPTFRQTPADIQRLIRESTVPRTDA
uniref:Protein kinase domain-containing protein n=1 Tax=Sordaria araneosa TaxID=573841 RepID=A0A1B4XBJ4_SORAA|nr:hypothetical protein [Sordaria araneosa]